MNADENRTRLLGEVIYHAQLLMRYAIICQVSTDKEHFYKNMLLDELEAMNKATGQLNYSFDPAYLQVFPRENTENAAANQ